VFTRVHVPSLLVAGVRDTVTPPETDADPAFAALRGKDTCLIRIERAGHQACSDVGLYLQLAPQVEGLPDLVEVYLDSLADQVTGLAGDPWRPVVGLHLRILAAWLDEIFDRDPDVARQELSEVGALSGVAVKRAPE